MAAERPVGTSFQQDFMTMTDAAGHKALETTLAYTFKNPQLLTDALTHPSLTPAHGRVKGDASPYERLEFLGDRVLGLAMARWLYEAFPTASEGDLAKRLAFLVSRETLDEVAQAIDLDRYVRLTRVPEGDKRQNLAARADAMEAIIGAMYLDGGFEPAERFVRTYWETRLHTKVAPADPKTALQEWAQGRGKPLPAYQVVSQSGPAHAPIFIVEVSVAGLSTVKGQGESKRQAEKAAALAALEEAQKS